MSITKSLDNKNVMLDDQDIESIERSLKTTIHMIEDAIKEHQLGCGCLANHYLDQYKEALSKIQKVKSV